MSPEYLLCFVAVHCSFIIFRVLNAVLNFSYQITLNRPVGGLTVAFGTSRGVVVPRQTFLNGNGVPVNIAYHSKHTKLYTKFGRLVLRKIIEIVATRCQIFRLNAPNSISAGALPQNPLGELTALPRLPSWT